MTFSERRQADIIVYALDVKETEVATSDVDDIRSDQAAMKVFLELPCPDPSGALWKEFQRKNVAVRKVADENAGFVITLMSKFQRWGTARLVWPSGVPTSRGFRLIAEAIAEHVDTRVVRRNLSSDAKPGARSLSRRIVEHGTDIFLARAERLHPRIGAFLARIRAPLLGANLREDFGAHVGDLELIQQFGNNRLDVPRNLSTSANFRAVQNFLQKKIYFAGHPYWGDVPFEDAIDWSVSGPNRSWRIYFLSLEFLNPVLSYLIAVNRPGEQSDVIEEISRFLKAKEISEAALLERVGRIIADFIASNPPDSPQTQYAWNEGAVSRRLRNLLIYLLCARALMDKGAKLNEPPIMAVYSNMRVLVEFLRNDNIYVRSGNHGVRQDALLVSAGLLMRDTQYGQRILWQGLDRLRQHQIATGLSSDGVWLENSFGYHCLVLRLLVSLVQDFDLFGMSVQPWLIESIGRMTYFVSALIKTDGISPLLGDTEPQSQERLLRDAGLTLERHGVTQSTLRKQRPAITSHFPDGGYFASYSHQERNGRGSSVVLSATLRNAKHKQADDLSIIFSHGALDLLVDGGAYNKEASDRVRDAARFDPASHNSYRVNGGGYTIGTTRINRPVSMEQSWEGDGWAACLAATDAYPDGEIARLVIHLKEMHALIVVDRLKARANKAVAFEQFWHIAPEFSRVGKLESSKISYTSPTSGSLSIALDSEPAKLSEGFGSEDDPLAWLMTARDKIVPTSYLRREKILRTGTMAALFQWSATEPSAAQVAVKPLGGKDFQITASGKGYFAEFSFRRDTLSCSSFREI